MANAHIASAAESSAVRLRAAHGSQPGLGFFAQRLERRLDALAATVLDRFGEAAGHSTVPLDLAPAFGLVREALALQLAGLPRGLLPERCPDYVLRFASSAASIRRPEALLTLHRVSHMVLWDAWFELLESAEALGPRARRRLLSRGSDHFFAYAQRLEGFVLETCRGDSGPPGPTPSHRRLEATRAVLEGDSDAASRLQLDLAHHHIGLVAWGANARAAASGLAKALGRPLLAVSPHEGGPTCWGWISGSRPLDAVEHRRLRSYRSPSGSLAVGLEAPGADGFRATHSQALRARCFANFSEPGVIHFDDVFVEALATQNEEDARAFVARELRGIDDESTGSRRIRETLAAYFAAEYNAASAAVALGIHQQTVANRLRAAEQRLGQASIGARRVELEIALRLRGWLAREAA